MKQHHLNDDQLQDYLDGNLKPSDPAAVHLDSCLHCQKALAAYRRLYAAIEETPEPQLAPDFADAVMKHLPRKYPVEPLAEEHGFRVRDSLVLFIAVAVMIAAGIYFINPDLFLKPFTALASAPVPQSQLLDDTGSFLSHVNISYLTIVFLFITFAGIALIDRYISRRRHHHKPVSFLV